MKKLLIRITISLLPNFLLSQVVIGDDSILEIKNEKALLSFTSQGMGIILPIIHSHALEDNLKIPGALFTSRADRQVKMWIEGNGEGNAGFISLTSSLPYTAPFPVANPSRDLGKGVLIGTSVEDSQSKGVLELNNPHKTLILPRLGDVNRPPHKYVKNPAIGTIGFSEIKNPFFPDSKPAKQFLWVFGGGTVENKGGQWHLWSAGVEMPPLIIDDSYFNNLP